MHDCQLSFDWGLNDFSHQVPESFTVMQNANEMSSNQFPGDVLVDINVA